MKFIEAVIFSLSVLIAAQGFAAEEERGEMSCYFRTLICTFKGRGQ